MIKLDLDEQIKKILQYAARECGAKTWTQALRYIITFYARYKKIS